MRAKKTKGKDEHESKKKSIIEEIELTEILLELIARRSRIDEYSNLSIVYDYLAHQFDAYDYYEYKPFELSEVYVQDKAESAFLWTFNFFIEEDSINDFFEQNAHLFLEDGIFFEMAYAHTLKKVLTSKNPKLQNPRSTTCKRGVK